ncbi:MAG: hypothetical protein ACOYNY_21775 [Caldilineaceae bacterium]
MAGKFDNFYFETLKRVLDKALAAYSDPEGRSPSQIDAEIVKHMKETTKQHYQSDPDIDYDDPLCRLGYLYTHAGANATLFERAISNSTILRNLLKNRKAKPLSICAVGGGPGTELLGITKYLLTSANGAVPGELKFRLLDKVSEWSETWEQISEICIDSLSQQGIPIAVKPFSNEMDVVDPASYKKFAWAFGNVDLFVFNYLLSENQIRLNDFACTLSAMVNKASPGSYFVFIDRIEYDLLRSTFDMETVKRIVQATDLIIKEDFPLGRVMTDSKNAWGDYLQRFSPRNPRFSFETNDKDKKPTVRVFVATRH